MTDNPASPKVGEIAAAYLAHAEEYCVRTDGSQTPSIHELGSTVKRIIEECREDDTAEFGPRRLKALRASWLEDGLAGKTINNY